MTNTLLALIVLLGSLWADAPVTTPPNPGGKLSAADVDLQYPRGGR